MMTQQPNESVADFAHRFSETQHELDELISGIHKTVAKEIELIFAFISKLHGEISKELVSREFKFDKLQEIIEAAQRYEHCVTPISVTKNISNPISKVQRSLSPIINYVINLQVGIRIINNVTVLSINRM